MSNKSLRKGLKLILQNLIFDISIQYEKFNYKSTKIVTRLVKQFGFNILLKYIHSWGFSED